MNAPTRAARKYDWRDVLTDEERATIAAADAAKAEWRRLNIECHAIKDRAKHRAKYRARYASKAAP